MEELSKIITASADKTIKVFDYPSFKENLILSGHTGPVITIMKVDRNRILSVSHDATVRLWNIENGVCLHTFNGHTSTKLQMNSLLIFFLCFYVIYYSSFFFF